MDEKNIVAYVMGIVRENTTKDHVDRLDGVGVFNRDDLSSIVLTNTVEEAGRSVGSLECLKGSSAKGIIVQLDNFPIPERRVATQVYMGQRAVTEAIYRLLEPEEIDEFREGLAKGLKEAKKFYLGDEE